MAERARRDAGVLPRRGRRYDRRLCLAAPRRREPDRPAYHGRASMSCDELAAATARSRGSRACPRRSGPTRRALTATRTSWADLPEAVAQGDRRRLAGSHGRPNSVARLLRRPPDAEGRRRDRHGANERRLSARGLRGLGPLLAGRLGLQALGAWAHARLRGPDAPTREHCEQHRPPTTRASSADPAALQYDQVDVPRVPGRRRRELRSGSASTSARQARRPQRGRTCAIPARSSRPPPRSP